MSIQKKKDRKSISKEEKISWYRLGTSAGSLCNSGHWETYMSLASKHSNGPTQTLARHNVWSFNFVSGHGFENIISGWLDRSAQVTGWSLVAQSNGCVTEWERKTEREWGCANPLRIEEVATGPGKTPAVDSCLSASSLSLYLSIVISQYI